VGPQRLTSHVYDARAREFYGDGRALPPGGSVFCGRYVSYPTADGLSSARTLRLNRPYNTEMITAFVLLSVDRGKINDVADSLVTIDGVSEVHSVAGRYDLVAVLRVATNEALADLVTDHIRKVEGITQSETLIGFRVYSRHDLERLFSIGME